MDIYFPRTVCWHCPVSSVFDTFITDYVAVPVCIYSWTLCVPVAGLVSVVLQRDLRWGIVTPLALLLLIRAA